MPDRRPGGFSAIPAARLKAYVRDMAQTNRLLHDVEVAQRATLTLLADVVLAAFLALALGVTVYDVGKWLTIW